MCLVARGLVGLSELGERIGQSSRCNRSGPFRFAGGLAQILSRSAQGIDIFRVGRRLINGLGIKSRTENLRALRNQAQLCRLVHGHKRLQRHDAEHFRQFLQAHFDLLRLVFRVRQHIDGVGPGIGVLSQIQKGRDRLDVWAPQIDWIEIEPEKIKQR